jgi:Fe-S-cluster containining protein
MLDKVAKKCSIYENRPLCCRAFPIDIFSRNGELEWGVYSYCPPERVNPIILSDEGAEIDWEIVSLMTSIIEEYVPTPLLDFLAKEDKIASRIEFLDDHANDFITLGPISKVMKE